MRASRIKNKVLDTLTAKGFIAGYNFSIQEEEPGSGMRETDRLVLFFSDGTCLKLDTFCSGSAENTSILIDPLSQVKGIKIEHLKA